MSGTFPANHISSLFMPFFSPRQVIFGNEPGRNLSHTSDFVPQRQHIKISENDSPPVIYPRNIKCLCNMGENFEGSTFLSWGYISYFHHYFLYDNANPYWKKNEILYGYLFPEEVKFEWQLPWMNKIRIVSDNSKRASEKLT